VIGMESTVQMEDFFEYWRFTTMFDQVESLKGKPKIFLIDDCEIGEHLEYGYGYGV